MLPAKAGTPTQLPSAPTRSTKLATTLPTANCQLPTANCRAFTLIELLVVVMLLTVLMLTAFPAFRGLERTTNRHRAIAEADALAQAALAYRRVYGQWPLEPKETDAEYDEQAFVYIAGDAEEVEGVHYSLAEVVKVLRGGESPQNPRGTRFLEIADDQLDDEGIMVDPWNQPYVLLMGRTKHDGTYQVRHHEGGVTEDVKRVQPPATVSIDTPEDVVAFSWGDPAIPGAQERVIGSWSKR
jgi:prepilin-type N-terminal cleavage/methylation domain-containing protein